MENIMDSYTERNIVIVYIRDSLTFGELIPLIKEYVINNCSIRKPCRTAEDLKDGVNRAIYNSKTLFDYMCRNGRTIYSTIHGKLEVDILAYALKPYYIKTGHLYNTKDRAIISITEEDLKKIEDLKKLLVFNDFVYEEILQYIRDNGVKEVND